MEDKRQLVADTGRILLSKGLVARTWGNISCRVEGTRFAISPSGLGYEDMDALDVPVYDYETETYEGSRKPSSEKKIHAAAYKIYEDVNFVIHTHQDYATAVSLVGVDYIKMTAEERELLGTIEVASYGLPGTGKLKKNVEAALAKGSKVVLMAHHGAVILGKDQEDAINKAEVLETVCKRTVEEALKKSKTANAKETLSAELVNVCKDLLVVTDENILAMAKRGGFNAQLDDIAQMLGRKLRSVDNDVVKILRALDKQDAVLVKGVGCLILTENPDDAKALQMLTAKAAMVKRYTLASNVKAELSAFDCKLMNIVYKKKYSKKKVG